MRRLLLLLFGLSGCGLFDGPRWEGPPSDHFDGTRFHNFLDAPRGRGGVLCWLLTREREPWPDHIDSEPGPPPPQRVGRGELRVTFVGHSTVLIQLDGVNVLTDPVWADHIGPTSWLGIARRRAPGLRFEDLPPIDVVVVSHNHYDHLDLETLRRLDEEHSPRFIVGLGNAPLLRENGIANVGELDWWDRDTGAGLGIVCVPAEHFSNRGLGDRNATLWCGFVLESAAGPVYFAGDTGWGPHFDRIRERLGRPRLALLPIGAYLPRWFMRPVHIDPAEAVYAAEVLGAHASVAIHHGSFPQADDGPERPGRDLAAALKLRRDPSDFRVLPEGAGWDVPPLPAEFLDTAPTNR